MIRDMFTHMKDCQLFYYGAKQTSYDIMSLSTASLPLHLPSLISELHWEAIVKHVLHLVDKYTKLQHLFSQQIHL